MECASGYVVLCKRLCGAVQAAMWWCASGYVVVAHEILVSAQGPLVLGFWVWGLRGLGPGLDKSIKKLGKTKGTFRSCVFGKPGSSRCCWASCTLGPEDTGTMEQTGMRFKCQPKAPWVWVFSFGALGFGAWA